MLTQILKVRRLSNQLVNLRFHTKRFPVAEVATGQLLLDAGEHFDRALVLHLGRLLLVDLLRDAAAAHGRPAAHADARRPHLRRRARPVPRARALGPPKLRDAAGRRVATLHPRDAAVAPLPRVARLHGRLVVEAPGQKRVVDELNLLVIHGK